MYAPRVLVLIQFECEFPAHSASGRTVASACFSRIFVKWSSARRDGFARRTYVEWASPFNDEDEPRARKAFQPRRLRTSNLAGHIRHSLHTTHRDGLILAFVIPAAGFALGIQNANPDAGISQQKSKPFSAKLASDLLRAGLTSERPSQKRSPNGFTLYALISDSSAMRFGTTSVAPSCSTKRCFLNPANRRVTVSRDVPIICPISSCVSRIFIREGFGEPAL